MQTVLFLLSLAFSAAASDHASQDQSTTALTAVSDQSPFSLRGNRKLDENVFCRFSMFDTMRIGEDGEPIEEHETKCIPIVNEEELDFEVKVELPDKLVRKHSDELENGMLLVSISNARLDEDEEKIHFIGQKSKYKVFEDRHGRYRHLQERHRRAEGEPISVAVIRVSTTDSKLTGTAASTNSIKNTMFSNGINFVTQYDACSFGKIKFELAEAGVFDVQLPGSLDTYGRNSANVVTAVQKQVKTERNLSTVSSIADKVIMCLPPGTGDWAASAGVLHWRAQMNDKWCTSLSGTMHEIGHLLGLQHSNANGVAYNDRSGYMGSGYTDTVKPRKCFNGYHSSVLKLYSDKEVKVNPVSQGQLVRVAASVDYNKAASNEHVIVSISDEYYLLYNVAKLFNQQTENHQNKVTVTEPLDTGTESRAGLDVGQSYDVTNFGGTGKTLKIKACRKESGGGLGADVMVVSIAMGGDLCGQPSTPARNSSSPNPKSQANKAPMRPSPDPKTAAPGDILRWIIEFICWLRGGDC